MAGYIGIEVAYASETQQRLLELQVPEGTTVRQAALLARLDDEFAELNSSQAPLGVFGERVKNAERRVVRAGDRVEIYRPLRRDPKKRRRDKAAD